MLMLSCFQSRLRMIKPQEMYQFIKLILIISMCLAEGLCKLRRPKPELCYDADVIIIGAGMSGVSAAYQLSKNGVDNFIILEGRNEIGGRMKNIKLGKTNIELGANWIHGTENNPIYDLAKKFKLQGQVEDPASVMCRNDEGDDVTKEFLAERQNLKRIFDGKGFGNPEMSVREALALSGWMNDTSVKNVAEFSLIDFFDAVSPEMLSAELDKPSKIKSVEGKQFFVTDSSGYNKIVHGMIKEILGNKTRKLKLNHIVRKILWNQDGVLVTSENGRSYTARTAIITCSIAVLQNSLISFTPKLPHWKLKAISKMKLAHYTKIFIKFPYRFWDNVEYIFHAGPTRGYFPMWQSLDASKRFATKTNILLLTVTENESLRIEVSDKGIVTKEIMTVLRKVYGNNIPNPENIIIPQWTKDPFYFGSYSYLPRGVESKDFVSLKGAVGPLLFAGEALHEVYHGYLHGAYFEGVNRAHDALQLVNGYWDTSRNNLDYDYYNDYLKDVSGYGD